MESYCIYIKGEEEHYTIKISENGKVKLFGSKREANDYAKSVGLKQYVVKYPD